MPNLAHDTLRGRLVQFRVRDIYLPQPFVILDELHGGDVLEGKVVEVSDGGKDGKSFLVIEVNSLRQPCILAVERILKTL
jgi:hypothetical protein